MSQKREQLAAAAAAAVQHTGLSNLSFRTLADEVGVKSSSVHYYFPEKSDLALVLINQYSEQFQTELAAIARSRRTARSKLLEFVKIFELAAEQDKFCLCGMMAAEVHTLAPSHRAALSAYFAIMEEWLVLVIAEGLLESPASAHVRAVKPQTIARWLTSGLEGALLLDRVDGKSMRLGAQKELIKMLFVGSSLIGSSQGA